MAEATESWLRGWRRCPQVLDIGRRFEFFLRVCRPRIIMRVHEVTSIYQAARDDPIAVYDARTVALECIAPSDVGKVSNRVGGA